LRRSSLEPRRSQLVAVNTQKLRHDDLTAWLRADFPPDVPADIAGRLVAIMGLTP
jgi:hypothetical protein